MTDIGIITDDYHLNHKMEDFVKYIKTKANLTFYLEEDYLIQDHNSSFEEDLFFVKSKGDLTLSLTWYIQENTEIPIINPYRGIWLATNRFLNSLYLKKAGIPVPEFSLDPSSSPAPFKDYIIKNIIDKKTYAFRPKIEEIDGHTHVADIRALEEAKPTSEESYNYYYYQKFIQSNWEYKIYGIGDTLKFYRQIPCLINPNKMESRIAIDPIDEVAELAHRAMDALDLNIVSLDFLKDEQGDYFLTDVNSTPNFNYIKNGPILVADYLLSVAKQ